MVKAFSIGRRASAGLRALTVVLATAVVSQVPACDDPDAGVEVEILELTNSARADAGCEPLTLSVQLNQAATAHSEDMASRNYFDHVSPEGASPGDRIADTGYQPRSWGENIAGGYPDAQSVMVGWMNSSGHRANILNCGFAELGVGYATNPNTGNSPYWTQVFASPRG